ncbi:MAG: TIGR02147 family protein [Bdellovibrionales bacterium]|nr:TIGR02147 family protein [Bdellovibrionales bacterium]
MSGATDSFDVFEFSDAGDLLNAYVEFKRRTTRYFSVTAWAKKVGLQNGGPLVNFMKKRRLPSPALLRKLVESMELDEHSREYITALVSYERARQAKTGTEWMLLRTMAAIKFRARAVPMGDREREVSSLGGVVVKELLALPGAPSDPRGIAERMRLPTSEVEVTALLEKFVAEGVLERAADGAYRVPKARVETETDVSSEWVRKFHRESLAAAASALESVPVDRRHFLSYVLPVERARVPEAKAVLERFAHEFVGEFEAPEGKGDGVYQLNLNCFPLTKPF